MHCPGEMHCYRSGKKLRKMIPQKRKMIPQNKQNKYELRNNVDFFTIGDISSKRRNEQNFEVQKFRKFCQLR